MTDFILRRDRTREGVMANVLRQIQALPDKFDWAVTIERHRKTRSDEQNAALFGLAYRTLRDETGNDPDDLHTYFCGEYFGWVERTVMGQRRRVPKRSTTKDENGRRSVMTTVEFADFFSFIQQRAAETVGVVIPDPDKQWRGAA